MNLDCTSCTESNSKWVIDLNIRAKTKKKKKRAKTIKLFKKKKEKICGFGLGKNVLRYKRHKA